MPATHAPVTTARQEIVLGSLDGHEVAMAFCHLRDCRADGFLMGSRGYSAAEEPIHRVVIAEDFWMGETPVTQAQFAVWTRAADVAHENHFAGHPDHPAESMTWRQANAFCQWLTQQCHAQLTQKTPEHLTAILPTEAQWEYACRVGTSAEYYTGDGETALREAGWFGEDWGKGSTHPVRALRPNGFGLYDMHGNVWEWCLDRWDEDAYRRRKDRISEREVFALSERHGDQNEEQRDYGESRVLRGGSWGFAAVRCRSACRGRFRAGDSVGDCGFRVCLVRSPFNSQSSSSETGAAQPAREIEMTCE